MKYVLNIYGDMSEYADATPEQEADGDGGLRRVLAGHQQNGTLLAGEALEMPETATTVKVRNGERLVTDGPFAETKEQLGGFYLVECKDLDEAIEWAAKIPGAQNGTIEVRPVMSFE